MSSRVERHQQYVIGECEFPDMSSKGPVVVVHGGAWAVPDSLEVSFVIFFSFVSSFFSFIIQRRLWVCTCTCRPFQTKIICRKQKKHPLFLSGQKKTTWARRRQLVQRDDHLVEIKRLGQNKKPLVNEETFLIVQCCTRLSDNTKII